MNKITSEDQIAAILKPETELERQFLADPDFRRGLFYGQPRYGHPEGQVLYHIPEVLANVDKLDILPGVREQLRTITFVHDTFKNIEDKGNPRDWSKHHSVHARKFLERFTQEEALLTITELHDEAYYAWRLHALHNAKQKSEERIKHLLDQVKDNLQLYYLFFKCDTQTGDKIQTPVRWFEENVKGIEVVSIK